MISGGSVYSLVPMDGIIQTVLTRPCQVQVQRRPHDVTIRRGLTSSAWTNLLQMVAPGTLSS
jgi:hypothetical protein